MVRLSSALITQSAWLARQLPGDQPPSEPASVALFCPGCGHRAHALVPYPRVPLRPRSRDCPMIMTPFGLRGHEPARRAGASGVPPLAGRSGERCWVRHPGTGVNGWGQELAGSAQPGGEPCLGGGCSSGARRCGPGRLVLAHSAAGRAAASRPSRRAISSPSSWRLTAPAPATWCTPSYGPAASSRSAAARSVTCTGHRRSSVNNAPVTAPAASACTYLSCAQSPSPMSARYGR
jgi:hypothetical protein